VYELLILILVVFAVGALRPRWSSLAVAVGVGAAAGAWVYMLEEVPGDPKGLDDVAWSAAFGAVVAVGFAFVCCLGVLVGRRLRARRSLLH
jgi:peptidoglycan/LPS O-acetylase OafA/YrhL